MKTAIGKLAVLLGLSPLLQGAETEKSPLVLFQEALYQEETEGDLDKAIELYEQVLDEAAEVKHLAARSLYQLGMCHLKKDEKAAAASYFKKVVSEYSGQTSVVRKANKQLEKIAPEESVEKKQHHSTEIVELALDDGKHAGKWSFSGGGHAVKFKAPGNRCVLKAVRIYGSRYGEYEVPKEDFSVWLCDPDFSIIKEFQFPYTTFQKRGLAKWVNLKTEPTEVPQEFILCVGFDPHRTKGIYLYHDGEASGSSFVGLPGSEMQPFKDGDWLFRAVIEESKISGTSNLPNNVLFKDSFEEGDDAPNSWEKGQHVDGVDYIWDRKHGSDGTSSLCLKKDVEKYFPIAQWTRNVEYNGTAKELSVSANVLAKKAYKAVIDALFLDDNGEWIKHEWVSYIGAKNDGDPPANHNWTEYSGTVDIPENTKTIVIGLQMYGPGLVCFDEVEARYSNEPEETSQKPVPIAAPKKEPLELGTLPFFDGEAMRLKLTTPAGMDIGQMIWQCRSIEQDGVFYDRIESYMHIGVQNFQQYTAVDTQRNSFLPVRGLTKNEMGTFDADYGDNTVTLKTTVNGKETVRNFDVSGAVYDNEQALYVIRALPLEVGYKAEFDIFPVQSGSVARCKVRVTDIQTIPCHAGEMECYAIKLAVYSGGIKALEHDLWISTDERRWLVKYDSGQVVMELMGAGKSNLEQPQKISELGLNYEFEIPAGWQFIHSASPGAYKISVQLLPPELALWAAFTGIERTGLPESIKEIAEGDIEILKGFFKNYTVRSESWTEQPINGADSASYIADYEDKGQQMVEYRAYIMGDSLVYWFVFRVEKDLFETEKRVLDSIVKSFNPKAYKKIPGMMMPEGQAKMLGMPGGEVPKKN